MKRVVLERLLLSTLVLAVAGISGDSAQHRSSPSDIGKKQKRFGEAGIPTASTAITLCAPQASLLMARTAPPRTTASWSPYLTWERHPRHRSATHDSCGSTPSTTCQNPTRCAAWPITNSILTSSDKAALRIAERKSTTLGGIAAVRLRFEYGSPGGRVTEEEAVALRSGV